jgi:hypothetical protein
MVLGVRCEHADVGTMFVKRPGVALLEVRKHFGQVGYLQRHYINTKKTVCASCFWAGTRTMFG